VSKYLVELVLKGRLNKLKKITQHKGAALKSQKV